MGTGRDRSQLERNCIHVDALNMPESDDVLDASKLVELSNARRGPLQHGRLDGSVDAQHDLAIFQSPKGLLARVAFGDRFQLEDDSFERCKDTVTGLEVRAIQDPRVAWADPSDVLGRSTLFEQPAHGVHGRLAATDDHVAGG